MADLEGFTPRAEERLRRALHVLAQNTPGETRPGRSRPRMAVLGTVAAAVVALAVAVVLVRQPGDAKTAALRPSPTPTAPSTGNLALGSSIAYDLDRLVSESQRIVVGRVTAVQNGAADEASGGLPYTLATIDVREAIRGPAANLVAFDYDLGDSTASVPGGTPWAVGEELLLFLSSPAGTVHANVQPAHWQVTGGAQGRYRVTGGNVDAPFTLDDVRAAANR